MVNNALCKTCRVISANKNYKVRVLVNVRMSYNDKVTQQKHIWMSLNEYI